MDDQHFDKAIKEKLGKYEDPDFDPTALADLRYRLASVTVLPWHARYRNELVIASVLLLFTVFNVLWQVKVDEKREKVLINMMDSLKVSQQAVADLQAQLSQQKTGFPNESIEVKESAPEPLNTFTTDQIIGLLSELLEKAKSGDQPSAAISKEVLQMLKSEGWIKEAYQNSIHTLASLAPTSEILPLSFPEEVILEQVSAKASNATDKDQKKHLSASTLRDLHKHFQQGIGIRVGPAASISGIKFQPGGVATNLAGGLLADFVLSPSLSLETGAFYTLWDYSVEGAHAIKQDILPGIDENLGSIKSAEIASQIIAFPLNAKFYFPLSPKTEGIISGGYAMLLYLRQDLEYTYLFDTGNEAQTLLSVKSFAHQSKPSFYPGTLNAAVGTSTWLNNHSRLEFSLFYHHGLGKSGVEQSSVSSLGLRTAYWFTVR